MVKTGRKRVYEDPMDVYTVRLTATHARKARRIGAGNLGQGLRDALDAAPWPAPCAGCLKRRASDRP